MRDSGEMISMLRGAGLLSLAALFAAPSTMWASPDPALVEPPESEPVVRSRVSEDIEILALRTGWVGIKEPHWNYSPPQFLTAPRIFLSRNWQEWLPVISYVVVSGDEIVVVDTGWPLEIEDPEFMSCDSRNKFFYDKNLRHSAKPEDAVDRRLAALGIAPEDVSTVVITHFHADHAGRIDRFPNARVMTGSGNWPSHLGSVPCTLPAGFTPSFPRFEDGPVGAFEASEKLTEDGSVRIVPLYGHTHGHVGVIVEHADRYWLMAGDATFSLQETEAGRIAGVSEDVDAARDTQARIRHQIEEHDTVLLPAHELEALERLQNLAHGPRS